MPKITIAVIASLLAGLAVGTLVIGDSASVAEKPASASEAIDTSVPLSERLARLEQVIAEERNARLVLEDELIALYAQIEGLESVRGNGLAARAEQFADARSDGTVVNRPRNLEGRMQLLQDRRIATLIEGGFSEEEARRLLRLESKAQYEAMQAGYEAERNGDPVDGRSSQMNPQTILRGELGDSEYERYLAAQGQRTTVQISNILDGSPGRQAGLQAGDEIVSYNGRRTFSIFDVRELTFEGDAGEPVVIEIDRNGVRMQLSIPRGPIGINGIGASTRSVGRTGG